MKFKGRLNYTQNYDGEEFAIEDTQKQGNMEYTAKIDLADVFRQLDGKLVEIEIKEIKIKNERQKDE